MNIINIEHISKVYGEKVIFDDASLWHSGGGIETIVGINGNRKNEHF